MNIQTFSVLVGSQACNAKCPFCVGKMTPNGSGVINDGERTESHMHRLRIGAELAERCGATTAMITGKGEPTLWPDWITHIMPMLSNYFPLVELQTNGIRLARQAVYNVDRDWLGIWSDMGLTTVAVSVAHWERKRNQEIYGGEHFEIPRLVDAIHAAGLSARLSVVMVGGLIDTPCQVNDMICKAKEWDVEQLTLMPINRPRKVHNHKASVWVDMHKVDVPPIRSWLVNHGDILNELAHGAEVFDMFGQNVCLSNCLGANPQRWMSGTGGRNLIFHPDGHLRTDWEHEGSVVL